ncbi:MAG: DUF2505 domain-containing protein [Propionibacteriaceae bacterium]|jgi:hypothetical protein|nr:DUF2505 domain-containing protein [Propionibacteriaceae bacterium]
MKFKVTLSYAASAAVVSEMLVSSDFQDMLGEMLRTSEASTVAGQDEITSTYRLPAPDPIRSYTGGELKLVGSLRWTTPLVNGRRTGELTQTAEHFPSTFSAIVTLHEHDGRTDVIYDCDSQPRLALLSDKVERMIAETGISVIERQQALGDAWLLQHASNRLSADPTAVGPTAAVPPVVVS